MLLTRDAQSRKCQCLSNMDMVAGCNMTYGVFINILRVFNNLRDDEFYVFIWGGLPKEVIMG